MSNPSPVPQGTSVAVHTDASGIPAQIRFDRTKIHHYRLGAVDAILVSMTKCGMNFPNVIRVIEPDSVNPLLHVESPFGMHTTLAILDHVRGIRSLPTSN